MDEMNHVHDRGLGPLTWRNYLPLVGVFALIGAVTVLWSWNIPHLMAVFFIVFALFKLTDIRGFAAGYADYDLLAMQVRAYAYFFPFLELAFGVLMVWGAVGPALLWTEFGIMLFSGLGVLHKLLRHEEIPCVCLGTWLKLPLTSVTLLEDFGMAALALFLLVRS